MLQLIVLVSLLAVGQVQAENNSDKKERLELELKVLRLKDFNQTMESERFFRTDAPHFVEEIKSSEKDEKRIEEIKKELEELAH